MGYIVFLGDPQPLHPNSEGLFSLWSSGMNGWVVYVQSVDLAKQ